MDELTNVFSAATLTPAEAQMEALRAFKHDLSTPRKNIRPLPPHPATNMTASLPMDVNSSGDQLQHTFRQMMEQSLHPPYPPPITLPCANVQPSKYTICKNPGTLACSACKLVSYCSKVSKWLFEPLSIPFTERLF